MSCTHYILLYVNKPKVIKGAGGMYGREERLIRGFGGETWGKELR